jgi:hypothetical protein
VLVDGVEKTANNYNEDGTPRGSSVDAEDYRAAVRDAILRYKQSLRTV